MTQYRKLIAALMAAATVAASVLADGKVSPADVIAIIGAFLGAAGVYKATNDEAPPAVPLTGPQ